MVLKPESSERLKIALLSCLQIFKWQSWNGFLKKWDEAFKFI